LTRAAARERTEPPSPGPETAAHARDRTRTRREDRPWYRYAARLLPAAGKAAARWLDLGCGQGEFLALARAAGLSGMGLDYWEPNARAARAAGPALAADLNRPLPLARASLDGAALIEVIEHIIRAEDLVAELARVIRPGGWLVLTTPNVAHLSYRWRALTGHAPKQEGYHYRFFVKRDLERVLAERGFSLDARASFGKQALLTRLARLAGRPRGHKVRYLVPAPLEPLLAQHFVWRLRRV
jgi:SAM-dependent methyltransferase